MRTWTFAAFWISVVTAAPLSAAPTTHASRLPLTFEANRGQTDSSVRFLARAGGSGFFFTRREVVLTGAGDVVRMRFPGASRRVQLTGEDLQTGKTNYFLGADPTRWHRDVQNFAKVRYTGIYPGIDLVYYGNQRQLEYDFVVGAGADPEQIALTFAGVKKLSIDRDGNLLLETPGGMLMQRKPLIYQSRDGRREPVDGHYVLHAGRRVGFHVAAYDTKRALVIDPVLNYSTYLGGSGNDIGHAIALDGAGNRYVTGETYSINFPGTSTSAIRKNNSGGSDAFVAKLNAAGTALMYTTYLGGSHHDFGYAIAVDAAGNAYVTGQTNSPTAAGPGNAPFPLAAAFQPSFGLGGDAFVTKINADGNALVYSTYFGGTGGERGDGIAVDSAGNAYVTGSTNSSGATGMPVANAFQPLNAGQYDAFIAKFNPAGSALVYSTYLGGTGSEFSVAGGGIAIDTAGNVYVAGTTTSKDFPDASLSLIQPTYGGDLYDGYVAKLNAAGSALVYSTYLGGSAREQIYGIAIDSTNNIYLTGETNSADFPTAFAFQPARASGIDAFVTKINAAGSELVYSTYLGGNAGDIGYAIGVDGAGNAYVSGSTDSTNFHTASPIQANNASTGDMFVTAFNASGSAPIYSTYLGGTNGGEFGYGIAVGISGNVHVTGKTNSTNFPTANAFQPMLGGGTDVFVIAIGGPPPATPTGLIATASSTTLVDLSWTPSPGAAQYEIIRTSGAGYALLVTVAGTSHPDSTALPGVAYVYRVRALDSLGQQSPYSERDVATTLFFNDDPLIVQVTEVRRTHITQLRQAVSAIRTTAGLGTLFTDVDLTGLPIRASHLNELRSQLAEARSLLGLSPAPLTNTLIAGTVVSAVHVQELRSGVK